MTWCIGKIENQVKKLQHLLSLARLVSDDTSLISEVRSADSQPLNYLNQFSKILQDRGIEKEVPELPWLALVDGLIRRNLLYELDWKDSPEEVIAVANDLTKNHKDYTKISQSLDKVEPLLGDDIEEFLPTLNRAIEKHEVQLVWIDINSDSYPLALIPLAHMAKAKELARESGYGLLKN